MAEKTFAAFFSYVHDDDTHDNGRITKLRQMLEEEVRALSGEDFEIFQDYEDIHWGQKWEQRLNGTLDGSTFLISIVTPRYIRKEFCRKEVMRFLGREKQLNRNDLVLSIYYIDTELSDATDPVVSAISSHQYFDWRDLRHEPYTNPEVRKRIEKMAREIMIGMKRSVPIAEKHMNPSEAHMTESTPIAETDRPAKRVEPSTIIVDPMPRRGDYTTITRAIEAAEPGARILIRPGLYKESLYLEKPLELIGDGKREEIIVEILNSSVVRFNTEFGRVTNLTLRQAGGGKFFAVKISQGRFELEDCDISSQSLSCIGIHNGADPRLRRNLIHNSKQSGVFIYDNGKGTLEDNEIFSNRLSGVAIKTDSDPTLRRNRIYENKYSGITIQENGKGILEDNEIFRNEVYGVEIKTSSDPTLRRNRIYENKYSGICINQEGKGIIDGNDIFENEYPGIELSSDSNPIVSNNLIHDGREGGVWIHSKGKGIFENNKIFKNTLSGVEVKEGGRPVFIRNEIQSNMTGGIYIHDNGGGTFENNDLQDNQGGDWHVDDSSKSNVEIT